MKKWQKKRAADRKAQKAYWEGHRYCEICLFEGRGRVEAVQVHEIIFRSHQGKCVPDNMISTCLADHERMHFLKKPYLHRDELYKIKLDNLSIKDIIGG